MKTTNTGLANQMAYYQNEAMTHNPLAADMNYYYGNPVPAYSGLNPGQNGGGVSNMAANRYHGYQTDSTPSYTPPMAYSSNYTPSYMGQCQVTPY